MKKGYIISRLQGLHNGHMHLIKKAHEDCDQLTVIIGSSNMKDSIKNPFDYDQRVLMTHTITTAMELDGIKFVPLPDFPYLDEVWEESLHQTIESTLEEGDTPVIYTSSKGGDDALRASWARDILVRSIEPVFEISATDVRKALLQGDREFVEQNCPPGIADMLFAARHPMRKKYLAKLNDEHLWRNSPYPVIKAATDAVIMHKDTGDILLIRRGKHPGKGLYALPGGHLEYDLSTLDNVLKEVKEETNIDLTKDQLLGSTHFDAPDRCEVGRMTTTGFLFLLDGEKPEVTAGDDADGYKWVNLGFLAKEYLYDDHFGIATLLATTHLSFEA